GGCPLELEFALAERRLPGSAEQHIPHCAEDEAGDGGDDDGEVTDARKEHRNPSSLGNSRIITLGAFAGETKGGKSSGKSAGGEEGDLFGRRTASEHRIAMREAAEFGDDVAMQPRPPGELGKAQDGEAR